MTGRWFSCAAIFSRGLPWYGTAGIVFLLVLYAVPVTNIVAEITTLPDYKKLRYEEDYSITGNVGQQYSGMDKLKYIPLSDNEASFISLGGEYRLRYEYTHSPGFGEVGQDKRGALFQRISVHADSHFAKNIRFFLHLTSALEAGRRDGPSPVEENKLEFQNAFIDWSLPGAGESRNIFRLGRQEINLGSGRLVDVREGPNVRRTFDGLRFNASKKTRHLSLFTLRPRLSQPGVFDDRSDKEKALWGAYKVSMFKHKIPVAYDLYYLGFKDEDASYEQGNDKETRHSLGTRLSNKGESWRYNWELVYQFGEFGEGNIQAWTLATETGYRLNHTIWRPLLTLSANVASGDKNPEDADLQSFNAMFPRGNYFSEAAVLGPRNFYNIHPFITFYPRSDLTLTADVNFFWRYETSDGVYGPSGNLIRASNGSKERFVGSAISFSGEWAVKRNLVFTAIYSHWFPGTFMKETGPSGSIDFIELTGHFKF